MAPELPTNDPAMMSMELFSEKPIPAAAQPEYELSIETTTGMSAPPMGMMISTPRTKASASMATNASMLWVAMKTTPNVMTEMPRTRFRTCWPGKTTGVPLNSLNLNEPESFPQAMTEPENVIAPMAAPKNNSRRLPRGISLPRISAKSADESSTAATAMNTAATPTIA